MNKKCIGIFCLVVCLTLGMYQPVMATALEDVQKDLEDVQKDINKLDDEVKDIQKEKDKLAQEQEGNRQQLSGVNSKINNITGAMDSLDVEIEGLDLELVAILTDISIIEQAVAEKEQEIADTEVLYNEAVEEERAQYEAMKIRIRYMYEQGDKSYVTLLLESKSIKDALNKADYIEKLYEYDRKLLLEYQETVEKVAALWDTLEEEKSELESSKRELEEQQVILEQILEEKRQQYEDYDARLTRAKQEAAVMTARINQQTNELRNLEKQEKKKKEEQEKKKKEEQDLKKKEEEEKKKAEEEKAKPTPTPKPSDTLKPTPTPAPGATPTPEANATPQPGETGNPTPSPIPEVPDGGNDEVEVVPTPEPTPEPTPAPPPASSKGQEIANYACQFIGNPYVAGGTSLTEGADCSGFTMSVFKAFGISLPRTSYAQSQVGRAVSYDQARAGDLIYYGGHVAIYIGGGQIVHASTERTGIKISNATYRPILTIRRVVD